MRKFWTYLLLGLMLFSLALAACQAEAPEAEVEEPAADVEEPAAEEKEPVVLKMITIADELEAKARAEMMEEFHKIDGGKWSHVTVEYDGKPWAELFPSIERSVATNTEVDIIQPDGPVDAGDQDD